MSILKLHNGRFTMFVAAVVAAVGLLGGARLPAADIPSQGGGYDKLAKKVDKYVNDLIRAKNLPGMSVAVSKDGRLLLSKGYGWARKDYKAVLMREDSALRIGSVTKCCVTGPAGWQLLRKKGIDPKKKRLYGRNGLFGNRFADDIDIALDRFHPIAAMAISANDKVYTWYSNGWVSIGSSTDLDRHTPTLLRYSLPQGHKPSDIRGAGITKHGKVYMWLDYTDAADKQSLGLVVGNWTNLRYVKAKNVRIPGGKSYRHIVAIAIAKSNDHVYAWYEDGTVSSGTSTDFGAYFGPKRMQVIKAGTGYDGNTRLRGVGISSEDHVYYWYGNGNTSAGTSTERGKIVRPRRYAIPKLKPHEDWADWYRTITIQNLYDHRSGFWGGGDIPGAAKMFGISEDRVTYEQLHRHFLRTHKLLDAPGKRYSYSNHGFGLFTLIIENLSGKSYRAYVRDNYLKPMGLHNVITPSSANPPSRYAWRHVYQNGKPVPVAFKDSGIGLAAGGFFSSARNLARLMSKLSAKYSTSELDQMGWGGSYRGSNVKLSHSGAVEGGTCYVAMFTKGYKSAGGKNLSNVHVVVITNTDIDSGKLSALADKIALAVPATNPPKDYDRWKGRLIPTGTSPRKGHVRPKTARRTNASKAKRTSPKKKGTRPRRRRKGKRKKRP